MATQKSIFVDVEYILNNTIVNQNVEERLLNVAIVEAMNIHLQPVLGTKLYKKLIAMIDDDSILTSTNINYKNLLIDYVQPACAQWTVFEVVPYLKYKLMNKTVAVQNSDNSTPIETADLISFRNDIRNKAEFYNQRMIDHIMTHNTYFPEYSDNDTIEDIIPTTNAYSSGFVFDDANDQTMKCMYLRYFNVNN